MSEPNQAVQLFNKPGAPSVVGDAASVARATQEIQAALVIAQNAPRDEVKAIARITSACQRKELAEAAEYEYSRGGTRITGPTIDLLRAVANRWGNIRYGWTEVERREGTSLVRCFAWDLQSNSQAERTFTVSHWRDTQAGGYALKDERDIYELLANMAARRVRACLEEVIDADVVGKAVEVCRHTMVKGETVPLRERAAAMVTAFAEFGVTQAKIETRLGNGLIAISENQIASLRRIYKSLKDGVGRPEDYFKPETEKPDFGAGKPQDAPGGVKPEPQAEKPAVASAASAVVPQNAPPPKPPEVAEPPAATPEPKPASSAQGSGFNPIKAVRGLAKMSGIKEGQIVDFLAISGATDGSPSTLEEVHMYNADLLRAVAENWPDVAEKIKGLIKKQKEHEKAQAQETKVNP